MEQKYSLLFNAVIMPYMLNSDIYTYPSPSSVGDFQRRVTGKGTTSVMENSRTLNAGDKIAHCHPNNPHTQHNSKFTALYFMNHKISVLHIKTRRHNHLKGTASSDGFICIEGGADVFAEKPADSFFDSWDSCGSSDYLHCIDVIPAQLCDKTTQSPSFNTQIIYLDTFNQELWAILDCSRTAFSGISTLIR